MKCHIESNHDVPRYPCKYWEAPLNAEARLKCEKCEHTLVFKTLTLKHTNAIHDDIRNTCEVCGYKMTMRTNLGLHGQEEHGLQSCRVTIGNMICGMYVMATQMLLMIWTTI